MKQVDMSVLPVGFLIEFSLFKNRWLPKFNCDDLYLSEEISYRPVLNHWQFNDGSMVLPDGLVVEFKFRSDSDDEKYIGFIYTTDSHECWIDYGEDRKIGLFNFNQDFDDVVAVKILGVTEEYGAQLGMGVIDA